MATILVVDDIPYSRYTTVRALERAGYDVREAASARHAVNVTGQVRPHLIVLDLRLPDADGFEVCRQLKRDPTTAGIPILMKTAVYRSEEDRKRGAAAGADDYLIDPTDEAAFLASVRRLIDHGPSAR